MSGPFDYFVVFAEMRTGSNFLETNLNAFDSFECHGEAFNPHFIGYPNKTEIFDVTQNMRDADPARLIGAIKGQSQGLGGSDFSMIMILGFWISVWTTQDAPKLF